MRNIYGELIDKLEENHSMVMVTKLSSKNEKRIDKILIDLNRDSLLGIDDEMKNAIDVAIDKKIPKSFINNQEEFLIEPFFPEARLIIFGGGNISEHLADLGAKIGFKVTVVDDRLSYANKERFPLATEVICESFENVFEQIRVNKNDYVAIVTRGHKYDKECLRAVLNIKPEYLGMIGSKRRVKGIKDQFIEDGYSEELVNKICSPIGFNIGGITPLEIAISIISQMIAQKRLGTSNMIECANSKKRTNYSDMDIDVLENLAKEEEERKALVTITSTKGSTPRGAGAKMIVWEDGRILGSIGGGCSEGEVILAARDLIADGQEGSIIKMEVDMTGDVAEDEGMVCGGIMSVLIEI
ncbi:XdhC/CoxI family protein [Clostridium sp. AL.422]|uniref:XdhC/CoxI family protein n=1 Tax=Clostridium TaxID=1485 RepID=UPI00293DFB4F|nr:MULTISPECIES: XdhC/CoxI family protein [unclassified Clostridium]MDV4152021.1 XdhC/CoxI family protein [Clostridium sp. AL.422]